MVICWQGEYPRMTRKKLTFLFSQDIWRYAFQWHHSFSFDAYPSNDLMFGYGEYLKVMCHILDFHSSAEWLICMFSELNSLWGALQFIIVFNALWICWKKGFKSIEAWKWQVPLQNIWSNSCSEQGLFWASPNLPVQSTLRYGFFFFSYSNLCHCLSLWHRTPMSNIGDVVFTPLMRYFMHR